MKTEVKIGQKRCFLCGDESAADVLIWPAGESELLQIEEETTLIARRTERPFLLAALAVENWNEELSPWEAPPVFGKEGFGAGAEEMKRLYDAGEIGEIRYAEGQ